MSGIVVFLAQLLSRVLGLIVGAGIGVGTFYLYLVVSRWIKLKLLKRRRHEWIESQSYLTEREKVWLHKEAGNLHYGYLPEGAPSGREKSVWHV